MKKISNYGKLSTLKETPKENGYGFWDLRM